MAISKNSLNVSRTVFFSSVIVLLVACVVAGFVGYSLKSSSTSDSQLQTNYLNLQSSYNQLQSSYQNLTSEYNQLNTQYQKLLTAEELTTPSPTSTPTPTPTSTPTPTPTPTPEEVSIQAASIVVKSGGLTTVYIEQTGGPAATVNSFIIKDTSGNTVGAISGANAFGTGMSNVTLTPGTLTTVAGTTPSGLAAGSSYTITITTVAGGSFISSSVVATQS